MKTNYIKADKKSTSMNQKLTNKVNRKTKTSVKKHFEKVHDMLPRNNIVGCRTPICEK